MKDLGKDANGNDIEYLELASVQGGVSIGAKKGEPFGVIRGRDFIYHENGQKLKRDNGAYQRTTSNTEVLGDIVPDWTGGIKNTLKYNMEFQIFNSLNKLKCDYFIHEHPALKNVEDSKFLRGIR